VADRVSSPCGDRGIAKAAALAPVLLVLLLAACRGSDEASSRSRARTVTVKASNLPGRIAYNTPAGDLWVMDADGSNRRRLTTSGKATDYNPTWSPDGRRIAFRTTRGASAPGVDPSNIFVINADGSGERQLTPPTRDRRASGGLFPAWSPRGDRIAFSNGLGINLIRPDGTGLKRLGVPGECSTWSPDGTQIMFCSNSISRGEAGDNWDLWVMNADGSGARALTKRPGQDYPGAWSPGGKRIAFFSRRASAGGDTFVMNADGSGVRRITYGPGAEAVNAWLPDDRLVVAVSQPDDEGPPDWYLITNDGTQSARLPQLRDAMDPIAWWWPRR
jgi:Tol biopolymer transport system component